MMVVVTNLGSVSYLVKNRKYDFEKAVILLNEAVDLNNKAKNIKDLKISKVNSTVRLCGGINSRISRVYYFTH